MLSLTRSVCHLLKGAVKAKSLYAVFSNMEPMTSLLPIKTELSVFGTKSEILKDTYVVTAQYLSCVIRLVQMPIVCLGTHMGICG